MSSALSEIQPNRNNHPKSKWWKPFTRSNVDSPQFNLTSHQNLSLLKSKQFIDPSSNISISTKTIFGSRLEDSLQLASVAISMMGQDQKAYIYGFIPVVVAKCGLYLKEDATNVEGIFRISGSTKRMKELQTLFDQPPFYGKDLEWKKYHQHHPPSLSNGQQDTTECLKPYYSVHDAANVLRRYLMCLPEPLISQSMYEDLKDVLVKYSHDSSKRIRLFKSLISTLSPSSQYLLLYLLDLLAVFANRSDKNLMTANNLAVVFQPALCPANPTTSAKLNRIIYAQRPPPGATKNPDSGDQPNIQQQSLQEQESIMKEVKQAQAVVEFMILNQNHFVVGLRPQIKVNACSPLRASIKNLKRTDDRPADDWESEDDRLAHPSTPRPTSCQSGSWSKPSCQDAQVTGPGRAADIRRSHTLPRKTSSPKLLKNWNGVMDQTVGSPVPASDQPPKYDPVEATDNPPTSFPS